MKFVGIDDRELSRPIYGQQCVHCKHLWPDPPSQGGPKCEAFLVKTGVRNNGLLNIRPDEFMGVTVPLPPLEEQQRIADVLDTARREIALLTQQLEAYRQQKRGLMQKLLTGQWRIPVQEGEPGHARVG